MERSRQESWSVPVASRFQVAGVQRQAGLVLPVLLLKWRYPRLLIPTSHFSILVQTELLSFVTKAPAWYILSTSYFFFCELPLHVHCSFLYWVFPLSDWFLQVSSMLRLFSHLVTWLWACVMMILFVIETFINLSDMSLFFLMTVPQNKNVHLHFLLGCLYFHF